MATLSGIRKNERLLSSVSIIAFTAMWAGTSLANPEGGNVVAGQATISTPHPSTLLVDQTTDKAIINWDSFNIAATETTRFQQPDKQSVTLNRDFSGDPSQIMGRLEANGRVFLINRSGILFGQNSRVDTAGLVASTHDITNENFLGGNYVFDQQGEAGASVVNLGNVTISDQGLAAFVGPSVRNNGAIVARLGTVELASANGFTLDFNGDEQLKLFVENPVDQVGYTIDGEPIENLVENQGRIEADGGLVVLSAVAARGVVNDVINHDGVIQANSVGVKNGKIILSGGDEGVVRVSGKISASGGDRAETGGRIEITGDKVGLFDGADVDASGHSGGGTVLVGGDYQGEGDTPTAEFTYVAANARVSADAQEAGDGGKTIVWADDTTRAYGTVTATGGAQVGDGGFIEISGKASLDIAGLEVDASAVNGSGGEVLFDPGDIHIVHRSDPRIVQSPASVFGPQTAASYISAYDIGGYLSDGTDVTIRATLEGPNVDSSGQVYVETSIQPIIRGGDREATLSLFSADQVTISNNVDIGAIDTRRFSGKLNIYIDADYDRHGVGSINLPASSSIYTNGGFVNLNGSSINTLGEINTEDQAGNFGVVREAHDFFEHTDFSKFASYKNVTPKYNNPFPPSPILYSLGLDEFSALPSKFEDFSLWQSAYGDYAEAEYIFQYRKDVLGQSDIVSIYYAIKDGKNTGRLLATSYVDAVEGSIMGDTAKDFDENTRNILNKINQTASGELDVISMIVQIGGSGVTILLSPISGLIEGGLDLTGGDDLIGAAINQVIGTGLGKEAYAKILEGKESYDAWAEKHPLAADNLESIIKVSDIIPGKRAAKEAISSDVISIKVDTNDLQKGSSEYNILNDPPANVSIELDNGTSFVTNDNGYIQEVTFTPSLSKGIRDNRTTKVGKEGINGDIGGHIQACRLGGSCDRFNLFPQNSNFNNSIYKKWENKIATALKNGDEVGPITVSFERSSPANPRPDKLLIEYSINGIVKTQPFENTAGGGA